MLAGLGGAILLIAAKRQEAIAATLSTDDFQTNRVAKARKTGGGTTGCARTELSVAVATPTDASQYEHAQSGEDR